MARRDKRFTIYDVMEARGDFDANKANAGSPDFEGPQAYPKMFYHPTGETKVIVPGEILVTPLGPKKVGELTEMISQVANNKAEGEALRKLGWHDHPAKALAAGGKDAPPLSPDQKIQDLEAEVARLLAQANDEGAKLLAADQAALTKGKSQVKDFMAKANSDL